MDHTQKTEKHICRKPVKSSRSWNMWMDIFMSFV